jgi:hypothetical protein
METRITSEEIINSLDGIQRAEPSPFLYTRIHARLLKKQDNPVYTAFSFLTRPSVIMAMVMLILLVNGYIMFNRNAFLQNQDEMGQTIAAEYGRQNAINPYELNEAP